MRHRVASLKDRLRRVGAVKDVHEIAVGVHELSVVRDIDLLIFVRVAMQEVKDVDVGVGIPRPAGVFDMSGRDELRPGVEVSPPGDGNLISTSPYSQ